jgi:hypothetical protein
MWEANKDLRRAGWTSFMVRALAIERGGELNLSAHRGDHRKHRPRTKTSTKRRTNSTLRLDHECPSADACHRNR